MLRVTVHTLTPEGSRDNPEGTLFDNVDYVSFVNGETFGPPALVAPGRDGQRPTARPEDRVLYINTSLVPLFEIERID